MHFLDKFTPEEDDTYELNFGTDIELPSGRMLCTGAFDAVTIQHKPDHGNPLPVTVSVRNNRMVHVTHHRTMEEAELAIVALAYFCDSVIHYQDLEEYVTSGQYDLDHPEEANSEPSNQQP